jgi:peptide deformylase
MTILTIARMGNPILSRVADPIQDPCDPQLKLLAADMEETMAAADGIGLAAPQVEIGIQMVLFYVPGGRAGEGEEQKLTVLCNPVITPLSEETEMAYEACLSVPGLMGLVPRWTHIHYRGLDLEGRVIEREARGFHARVVQHECDHLFGRLYLSRMTDLGSLAYRDELARLAAEDRA